MNSRMPGKAVVIVALLFASVLVSFIMGVEEVSVEEVVLRYSSEAPSSCVVLIGDARRALSDDELSVLLSAPLHRRVFYRGSSKEEATYSLFLSDGSHCGDICTNGEGLTYKGSNYAVAADTLPVDIQVNK